MKRVQVMLDDSLSLSLETMSKENSLPLSTTARLIISDFFNNRSKMSDLDQGVDDLLKGRVCKVSREDFKNELRRLSLL